jgi:NADH:ubiquinone oxidoreductase subunit 3 (subunit A)
MLEEEGMEILLSPPVAFLLYIPLVTLIALAGRSMAAPGTSNVHKHMIYGSGEEAKTDLAAPGYRPFFLVAFFFAILHLGMLVLGSGSLDTVSPIYLIGLLLALMALILG